MQRAYVAVPYYALIHITCFTLLVSGNAKLFIRDRDFESWRPCYYNRAKLLKLGDDMAIDDTSKKSLLKPLFYEDDYVLDFIGLCDLATGKLVRVHKMN